MKVSVVIPAKNEADGLRDVLPRIVALDCVHEIIVVDDGSSDDTAIVCEHNSVKRLHHPVSKGNGAAIKAGARVAQGDVIVFMDGDGQHQPEEISVLLAKYKEGYDLVVGARDSEGQANWFRAMANGVYNRFASWMTGHQIKDLTSGFRVVNADKFKEFLYMLPNGFSYPTTSTMAFFRTGYSVGYLPIRVLQRKGDSHISLFKDGLKFFLIIFKVATLYSPLRIFGVVSLMFFSAGFGYYLYSSILYGHGRFSNMAALLMVASIMTFLIGLVSEQVSTLFYKR